MRRTFRWNPNTQKVVEIRRDSCEIRPQVMPDIQPYKSMITGEMITGRAQHREHLRRHDCQEVGNEKPDLTPPDFTPDFGEVRDSVMEANRQLQWNEAPRLEQLHGMRARAMRDMGLE